MKNAELKRFYAAVAALVMASGTTVTAFAEEVADAGTAAETSAAEVKTETSDYSGNYGKDVNWKYDPICLLLAATILSPFRRPMLSAGVPGMTLSMTAG